MALSTRVWTVPNLLSMLRLIAVPVFLALLIGHHDTSALIILAASGITDYLDGKIARHYGLVTRLGQLLDPAADRLYILSTLLGLAYRAIIPWWLVIALLAREAFIAVLGPVLRRHRLPIPPVHFIGKLATFCLICAFPLILLGQRPGDVGPAALPLGWAFAWWGLALYWVAGLMYAWQVRGMVLAYRARAAS